ncbi:DUF4430 domain-containing protein, partial [Bacillus paranthracis]|uniref:DUF4430 domain-containing protein n=1 Tax=Bacillus paranthracis TaxID=2026186 RepID=UPI002E1F7184|nr:DUF4430 domain-containing protein [Bacillus paranthracis]
MAMLKKWLLTSLMAVTLVFVSFANTVHITFAEGNTAKLAIIGESQKGIMLCPKEEQIKDGETALSLLQKVMGDKVEAETMSFGTYVKGIDGLMAGATSGWLYDVNDKSAEVGADSYKLKSGDVVVFRFVSDWSKMSQETLQQTLDKFGTCKTVEEPKTDDPKQEKPEEPKTDDPKQEKPEEPKTDDPKQEKPEEPKTDDLKQEKPKQENIQVPAAQVNDAIAKTSEKMLQDGIESDWVALGLSRSGKDIPIEAKLNYVKAVTEKVEKRVNRFSATDLARTIIMM